MKMQKVGFTYPGAAKATLRDVTVRCNLNSRVAVLGVRRKPYPRPLKVSPTQKHAHACTPTMSSCSSLNHALPAGQG